MEKNDNCKNQKNDKLKLKKFVILFSEVEKTGTNEKILKNTTWQMHYLCSIIAKYKKEAVHAHLMQAKQKGKYTKAI